MPSRWKSDEKGKVMKMYTAFMAMLFFVACQTVSIPAKESALRLFTDSLYYRSSGFRYVTVEGDDWWISRLVVQDSTVDVGRRERAAQLNGDNWSKSCSWLIVNRTRDNLTVRVDADKKTKFDDEHFRIEIQGCDTLVTLNGTLGGLLSGIGEDIQPSPCGIKFNHEGGKIRIALKAGQVESVTVDGQKASRWSHKRPNLNDYTCDWLTIHCEPGKWLELEAVANPTKTPRTFSLSLVHLNSYAHLWGIQQASVNIPPTDTIGFSLHKINFPLEGGTMEVVARTTGWMLDEKSYGLDWLTIEPNGNRLKLTATPNFDYDKRHFVLRFKKGDYYEYLEGNQEMR